VDRAVGRRALAVDALGEFVDGQRVVALDERLEALAVEVREAVEAAEEVLAGEVPLELGGQRVCHRRP